MPHSDALQRLQGPLAKAWLAAHYEKRLNKKEIVTASIASSVDAIVNDNNVQQLLRLTSQLLVGIVRIYSRKTKYLLDECNEAMFALQMAFRIACSSVDLQTEISPAHINQITLNDAVTDVDLIQLPALDIRDWESNLPSLVAAASRRLSQAKLNDITLAESLRAATPERMRGISQLHAPGSTDVDMDFDCPAVDFGFGFGDDGEMWDEGGFDANNLPMEIEVGRRNSVSRADNAALFSSPLRNPSAPEYGAKQSALADDPDESLLVDKPIFAQTPGANREATADGVIDSGATLMFSSPFGRGAAITSDASRNPAKRRRALALDDVMEIDADMLSDLIRDTSALVVPEKSVLVSASVSMDKNITSVAGLTSSRMAERIFSSPLLSGLCDDILKAYPNPKVSKRPRVVPEDAENLNSTSHVQGPSVNNPADALDTAEPHSGFDHYFADAFDNDFDDGPFHGSDWNANLGSEFHGANNEVSLAPQTQSTFSSQLSRLSLVDDDAENSSEKANVESNISGYSVSTISVARELVEVSPKIRGKHSSDSFDASKVLASKARADAARTFYELLLLSTRDAILVSQETAFGGILISTKKELAKIAKLVPASV